MTSKSPARSAAVTRASRGPLATWRIVGTGRRLPRATGRVSSVGLALVLLFLAGFTAWSAVTTDRAIARVTAATSINDHYEQARYALVLEESRARAYQLAPSAEQAIEHRQTTVTLVQALNYVRDHGTSAERSEADMVLADHARYVDAAERMFAAVDAGDMATARAIDQTELVPLLNAIEQRLAAAADQHRAEARQTLDDLTRTERLIVITTVVAFTVGLTLVGIFGIVLRQYQRRTDQADLREARLTVERVEREQALLRASEERFRALVRHASDVIAVTDSSGKRTYISPSIQAALGYELDELLGGKIEDLVHPDDLEKRIAAFQRTVATPGEQCRVEFRIRHADGSWRVWDTVSTNLLHEPAVAGIVINARDITERKAFGEQLERQAFHDALTGLANRALFMNRLEHALLSRTRGEGQAAVLFLDLDRFKVVNDSLGHEAGDRLLVAVAQRLVTCVRPEDTVARFGGDEFSLLLENVAIVRDVAHAAERIFSALREPFDLGGQEVFATASIGVSLNSLANDNPTTLMRDVDAALYRAKRQGGNCYQIFEQSMNADTLDRLALEADLRRAIDRGELLLHYQPLYHLESRRLYGFEALVRWRHPQRGLVSPATFIPLAEELGLIRGIGRWVLAEACGQARQWQDRWPLAPALIMSVNLSAREIEQPELVRDIAATLRNTGVDPATIQLEITESALMAEPTTMAGILHELKALGVRLAIDDFGTGYSSLSYLKRFPADVLKVDKSFVDGLGADPDDTAIVLAIVTLAHTLGLEVTAEGVETAAQEAQLQQFGCEQGQGYYYAKPLPVEETEALLASLAVPPDGV